MAARLMTDDDRWAEAWEKWSQDLEAPLSRETGAGVCVPLPPPGEPLVPGPRSENLGGRAGSRGLSPGGSREEVAGAGTSDRDGGLRDPTQGGVLVGLGLPPRPVPAPRTKWRSRQDRGTRPVVEPRRGEGGEDSPSVPAESHDGESVCPVEESVHVAGDEPEVEVLAAMFGKVTTRCPAILEGEVPARADIVGGAISGVAAMFAEPMDGWTSGRAAMFPESPGVSALAVPAAPVQGERKAHWRRGRRAGARKDEYATQRLRVNGRIRQEVAVYTWAEHRSLRTRGRVQDFFPRTGHGFIVDEQRSDVLFFHEQCVVWVREDYGRPVRGEIYHFSRVNGRRGPWAAVLCRPEEPGGIYPAWWKEPPEPEEKPRDTGPGMTDGNPEVPEEKVRVQVSVTVLVDHLARIPGGLRPM